MADNKQYITNKQDDGTVLISEDVIISIAIHAISDVPGVVSVNNKPASELADMFGKRWGKGVRVTIDEYNNVAIDVDVVISYGQSVVTIASEVQNAVINAVQAVTGVDTIAVNVNVNGISRQ